MYLCFLQRLAIAKEFGDKSAERRACSNLGNAHMFLGEFQIATELYKYATLFSQTGFQKVSVQYVCMLRLYIEDLSQNKYSFCTKLLARNFVVVFFLYFFFLYSSHNPHFLFIFFIFAIDKSFWILKFDDIVLRLQQNTADRHPTRWSSFGGAGVL